MKMKLCCVLLASGLVLATEEESAVPPPGSLSEVPAAALPRYPGPADAGMVSRFKLVEGHVTGDGTAVRRMFRIDEFTGDTWFQHEVKTTKGSVSYWLRIYEPGDPYVGQAYQRALSERQAEEAAKRTGPKARIVPKGR